MQETRTIIGELEPVVRWRWRRAGWAVLRQAYLVSCVGLLGVTAAAKLISTLQTAPLLNQVDDLFNFLTNRQLLWAAAALEAATAWLVWRSRHTPGAFPLLAWLGSVFALYRLGLLALGTREPCQCLGGIGQWLGLANWQMHFLASAVWLWLWVPALVAVAVEWRSCRSGRKA